MNTLFELARLCSKQSRVIESLLPPGMDSPLRKLYCIVGSNEKLDDHECMLEIYGKRNTVAFSRLKSRLREVFYHAIILQNNEVGSEVTRFDEVVNAYRLSVIVRILNNKKTYSIANDILEKSIVKSMRYHLTENVLAQVRLLIAYNATASINDTKRSKYRLNKYREIQEKYLRIYEWELRSENYFLDLERGQSQSLANVSAEVKRKAFQYYTELQEVNDIRSYNFNYNKYRILAAYFEYEKDFNSLLNLSDKAFKEFSAPDLKSEAVLANISLRRLWAFIQAGRFKDAYSLGIKLMDKQTPGSNIWFRIGHYTLKAKLYEGDLKLAIALINLLMNNPKFQKISDYYKEIFYTTLGYIHLVVDSGTEDVYSQDKGNLPEFKIGRFLNTTPVFSKDKRGINVSILMMHTAFLLQRKDYDSIIDKVDSLNQYAYRYLRKDDSFRSNCMIKMVIQMTKADFNPIRTERYTADLRKQLSGVKLAGSGENIEIEVIPFEVLWDIMVKSL